MMRTTIVLDDDLLGRARELTGEERNSELVRRALKALIHSETSKRLALLGGSDPDAAAPPRHRDDVA
jgi:Arc/MetJ family transcription regulator